MLGWPVIADEKVCQSISEGARWRSANSLGGARANEEGQEIKSRHETSQEERPPSLGFQDLNLSGVDLSAFFTLR